MRRSSEIKQNKICTLATKHEIKQNRYTGYKTRDKTKQLCTLATKHEIKTKTNRYTGYKT